MKRTMFKDLIREIRNSFSRFMAVFAIVLLGVAFYAGVSASPGNMRHTAELYFDGYRLQDLRLVSSIGFNDDDAAFIRKTPGVRGVYASRTVDVLAKREGGDAEYVVSVSSFPIDTSPDNEDYINRFRIAEGRLPENASECAVRAPLVNSARFSVGDRLILRSGADYELSEVLASTEVTVVGIVYTPYSISFDLGSSSVGNGSVSALAYVPDTAFLTDYYTNVYVTAEGAEALDSFGDAYFGLTGMLGDRLETLGETRIAARTEELRKEIYEAVEQEVTEEVTAAVAEEVEKAAEEEIETAVREEVENAVLAGIEDEVRERLSEEVQAGIEEATREKIAEAVRAELESTVRSRVTEAVREAIANEVRTAVTEGARDAIAQAVKEEFDPQFEEAFAEEVHSRVEEGVKAALAAEVRNQVTRAVKEALAAEVRTAVTEQVKAAIAEQVRAELTAQVTAEVEQQVILKYLPESMKEEAIRIGVELLYDAAYQAALDQYLDQYVNEAYPAAYQAAEDQYLDQYVNEQYPAAYQAAEDQYLEQYVNEQYPAALEQARAGDEYQAAYASAYNEALNAALSENLEAAVDQAYPAALETALSENLEKTVNEQYPAALEEAMKSFDEIVEEQYQAVIGDVLSENLEKTVDEKYPEILEEAVSENLEKTVDEVYPEAYEEALATWYRDSADETIRLETGKILTDKINEVYEEQLRENLDGASEWQWYVLDRNYQQSYMEYKSAADQMTKIAVLFPLFFFFVAGLVCFTTMTRMVDEQRTLIGTYKALGYPSFPIAMRYILYAFFAAVSGGIIGSILGIRIFPAVIFTAWSIPYQMPDMQQADNMLLIAASILTMTIAVVLAAVMACLNELRSDPASLMRPKAPKLGKTVLLEHIGFFWKRLSFTGKVTVRNIFRYKKRFFMTLAGVAGCTALLVTGFGIKDSVSAVVVKQFEEILNYDTTVTIRAGTEDDERERIRTYLEGLQDFSDTAFIYTDSALAGIGAKKNEGREDLEITLTVPLKSSSLGRFVNLRDPSSGKTLEFGREGVYLSKRGADELSVSPGDSFYIETSDGVRHEVTLAGFFENYTGYPVYMTMDYYESVFGRTPVFNTVFAKNADPMTDENALGRLLMEEDSVAAVSFISKNVETISSMIGALGLITVVLIISSALLCFVVLYNLSNVNISERLREIATIKVLGFYDGEVNAYVYRETIAITVLGALFGLGLGIGLHHLIMNMVSLKTVSFGNEIKPMTYVYSFLLTIVFSVIVSFFVNIKLKKIPMVESLKSVE